MIKGHSLLIALVLVTLIVVACGGGAPATPTPTAVSKPTPTPTPAPGIAPTAIVTATPTPAPKPTPPPTPTANPTPQATPTAVPTSAFPCSPEPASPTVQPSERPLYVRWYLWEPRVVAVDQKDDVTLTVGVDRPPTRLEIVLSGGGTVRLNPISPNLYRATLSAEQVLSGYQTGDDHNVVGFLEAYEDSARIMRLVLNANVRHQAMPNVPITTLSPGTAQMSPHVVNLRYDSPHLAEQVPPDIIRSFYTYFGDDYDFIAVVEQFRPRAGARFYRRVRNDTLGLGLPLLDNGATYGSPSRLQGIVDYPIDSFFDLAEKGSIHELGHRWISYLNDPALTLAQGHWLISDLAYGIMGGSSSGVQGFGFPWTLVEQPDGDYLVQDTEFARTFNDLELYLMGLVPKEEVGEHFVFQNQDQTPRHGGVLAGPVDRVTIDDIIAVYGPRVPGADEAQTSFRIATIVLSWGCLLSPAEMAFFDHMAARGEYTTPLDYTIGLGRGVTYPFYLATGRQATLSTSLLPP